MQQNVAVWEIHPARRGFTLPGQHIVSKHEDALTLGSRGDGQRWKFVLALKYKLRS
jgi:hypothetical protein